MDQFIRTGIIFLAIGLANLALLLYYLFVSPSGGTTLELVLHTILGVFLTIGGVFILKARPVKREIQE